MTYKLRKKLEGWKEDATNGLAHAHGVKFTAEVAEYITKLQFRHNELVKALEVLLEANDVAINELGGFDPPNEYWRDDLCYRANDKARQARKKVEEIICKTEGE